VYANADDCVKRLDEDVPRLRGCMGSPDNCFLDDDGAFTYHGVFSEFSHYVRDNFALMEEQKKEKLFHFIESWVSNDDPSDEGLDNAVRMCFLENLAGERSSPEFRRYMGSTSLQFFNQWDNSKRHTAT
jgi:hypothetical protein